MRIRNEKGFTLIEILMVVLIFGIIVAAVLPFMRDYSSDARDARIAANTLSTSF